MGNSLHGASLLSNDVHFPYHIQLGDYTVIDIDEKTIKQPKSNPDALRPVMLTMLYNVVGSKCRLEFERYFFEGHKVNKASFSIHDDVSSGAAIHLTITKGENNFNEAVDYFNPELCFTFIGNSFGSCNFSSNINMLGVVTKTSVITYGSHWKGSHVILEEKKKSKDGNPFMVTMAHYYVVSNGSFGGSKIDIGLSTIVKVQVSNDGGLDIKVEGPMQHPVTSLLYMFDEVGKTGIWKPTICPHCAKLHKMQRNWSQSESEESDNFPPPRRNFPKQMGRSVVANAGQVKGNNNGNLTLSLWTWQTIFQGKYFK